MIIRELTLFHVVNTNFFDILKNQTKWNQNIHLNLLKAKKNVLFTMKTEATLHFRFRNKKYVSFVINQANNGFNETFYSQIRILESLFVIYSVLIKRKGFISNNFIL